MYIDPPAVRAMARSLDNGADDVEGVPNLDVTISGAEPEVLINAMVAQVESSAGAVVDGMRAAAEMARMSMDYYERADADVAADLATIESVMDN